MSTPSPRTFLTLLAALASVFTTPASGQSSCPGDCDGNRRVTIAELTVGVRIALGRSDGAECPAFDTNDSGSVSVAELIAAIGAALDRCGGDPDRIAFVLATDFVEGSFGTVEVDEPRTSTGAAPERLTHSDATARAIGGDVFVVNRLGSDSIQKLDPSDGFATVYQCSTGLGSNPQDIVIASEDKGYVSVLEQPELLIIDPTPQSCASLEDFVIGDIDLSSIADADGNPDMWRMFLRGNRLYVAVQRLDINSPFREPADNGAIAVIDIGTDTLIGTIELSAENPFGTTKGLTVRGNDLYISEVGQFGVNDGGIERVDLTTRRATGFVITEESAGGDIVDFLIVSDELAYAIVSKSDFTTALVTFSPASGDVGATILQADGFDYSDIELNDRGEIYLADRNAGAPGVRVFRASDGVELTGEAINIGLGPAEIVFAP